jgi:hypothetical protein
MPSGGSVQARELMKAPGEGGLEQMTMLAGVVDAVVGSDTHRDTHALQMLEPNETTIAALAINALVSGLSKHNGWTIAQHAGDRAGCQKSAWPVSCSDDQRQQ